MESHGIFVKFVSLLFVKLQLTFILVAILYVVFKQKSLIILSLHQSNQVYDTFESRIEFGKTGKKKMLKKC